MTMIAPYVRVMTIIQMPWYLYRSNISTLNKLTVQGKTVAGKVIGRV